MLHEILRRETIYTGRAFAVEKVNVRLPNDKEAVYDLVQHPGAVTIVPVDDLGNIWFVRQYRVGVGETLLELPAGTLESGENPDVAAAREVREEIGMAAGELHRLGEFYMAPGYSTEHMFVYLGLDLHDDPLTGDDDEFLGIEKIPMQQAYAMVRSGELKDGKSLAAMLMAMERLLGE